MSLALHISSLFSLCTKFLQNVRDCVIKTIFLDLVIWNDPICSVFYAIYYVFYAICYVFYAICSVFYAIYSVFYAICYVFFKA